MVDPRPFYLWVIPYCVVNRIKEWPIPCSRDLTLRFITPWKTIVVQVWCMFCNFCMFLGDSDWYYERIAYFRKEFLSIFGRKYWKVSKFAVMCSLSVEYSFIHECIIVCHVISYSLSVGYSLFTHVLYFKFNFYVTYFSEVPRLGPAIKI